MADRNRESASRGGRGADRAARSSRLQSIRSRSQLEFELDLYDRILKRRPHYVAVLKAQASNLAAAGRHAESLELDRRLAQLRPDDPIVHYNLGCSYAQLGQISKALAAIERCLELGYRDFEHMLSDEDLEELHSDARFIHLIHKYWDMDDDEDE